MDGKIIIIGLFTILLYNCKKKENIQENGKELIFRNINILLDSVERFDMSKVPPSPQFKDIVTPEITLGLRDSITIDTIYSSKENELKSFKYFEFNLVKKDLIAFKSHYKLFFQKGRSMDVNILSIEISNLRINEIEASVEVAKVIGISAIHDRFYFKKENGVWVFKKKIKLGIG